MQLRDYSFFFQPKEFEAMTAAYDAAWQHLWAEKPRPLLIRFGLRI
jgi:hypothetical protein